MTKFHLKNPQKNIPAKEQQPSPIVMTYHFQGTRLRFGVGESILPADWSATKQRPRSTAKGCANLTKLLDRLSAKVKDVHLDLKSDFTDVTPDTLRKALVREVGGGTRRTRLIEYFEQFVENKRVTKSAGTASAYNNALNSFKTMPGSKEFADIDPDWAQRYKSYMENRRDKTMKRGASHNYIATNLNMIKEVMTAALKDGLHRNVKYKEIKVSHELAEAIYLTQDELSLLRRVELPPRKDRLRDRFLIACYTGLRYSDVSKITKDNVRDGVLRDRNKKTGADVTIPLHPVVVEIMAKYPGEIPKAMDIRKAGPMLKDICREAGIRTPVVVHKTRGGEKIRETIDKCDLVSTHTARRSFATHAALAGIPLAVIAKFTGHTTTDALSRYIRFSATEATESVSSHPFFSGRDTEIGDKT